MSKQHHKGCEGTGLPSPACPFFPPRAAALAWQGADTRDGALAWYFGSPQVVAQPGAPGRLLLKRAKVFLEFNSSLIAGLAELMAARDELRERRSGCGWGLQSAQPT